MAYLNKIDINGRTYYLQHLTDGKNEAKLPTPVKDDELLLRSQVINSVTSKDSQNGYRVPLSASQGYLLNSKLNKEILDREADVGEEQSRAEAAEQVLTNNLNQEIQDRTEDVNAEEIRALAAEKVLTDNLAQEITDRINAITTEQNRATAKENEISADLTAEINRAKSAEQTNATEIATEKSRAEEADKANADAIAALEEKHNVEIATKVDKVEGSRLMTVVEGDKLAGIAENANNYSHPVYNTYASSLYKITIDKLGHVTKATVVTKEDITGLGIPAQDTTYSDATTSASGLLSSTDKITYDGYATLIAELQDKTNELEGGVSTDNSIRKAAPRNLLDNSDFRNPVNQRGAQTATTKESYPIDRWRFTYDGTTSVGECFYDSTAKCIRLRHTNDSSTNSAQLKQVIPVNSLFAGTYTVAIHTKTNTPFSSLIYANDTVHKVIPVTAPDSNGIVLYTFSLDATPTNCVLYIYAGQGKELLIDWVAIYDGEYTSKTLPEYRPKGYGAELAECQRYYLPMTTVAQAVGYGYTTNNTNARIIIPTPVTMRAAPSISGTPVFLYRGGSQNGNLTYTTSTTLLTNAIRIDATGTDLPSNETVMVYSNTSFGLTADL